MTSSSRPWVVLVALVALVAPLGDLVAAQWPRPPDDPRPCFPSGSRFRRSLDTEVLEVDNGGYGGDWGDPELCPRDSFATGFQLKVEPYQGFFGDDTGLNGVRLICDTGRDTVTSSVGPSGVWKAPVTCPRGQRLVAFRLRVDNSWGIFDNSAANDMVGLCSGGTRLEGRGSDTGSWGAWSERCPSTCSICGIQTRVEPPQGRGDDTALNDVRLHCCAAP